MQVQNRFQPIRLGGPNAQHNDFSQFNDTVATDCFDGSTPQGQICLPKDPDSYKKLMDTIKLGLPQKQKADTLNHAKKNGIAQSKQDEALFNMLHKLNVEVSKKEQERTKLLKELAILAFHHSLLTEKNLIIEHGGVINDNWLDETRKLKHPPKQAQNLDLQSLLLDKNAIFSTKRKLKDVNPPYPAEIDDLYFEVMGDAFEQKPDPAKQKANWGDRDFYEHKENLKTQKQLEADMEQFIEEKLEPHEKDLNKTREEAKHFQELDQQEAPVHFQKALSRLRNQIMTPYRE